MARTESTRPAPAFKLTEVVPFGDRPRTAAEIDRWFLQVPRPKSRRRPATVIIRIAKHELAALTEAGLVERASMR